MTRWKRSGPGHWTPGPIRSWLPTLVLKVREGGRVVNVHALLTGVNGDGHREILGLQVTSAEDGAR